jgi:subtilisin family serine protease
VPGLTVVKLSQSQSVADSLLRFRGKEEILYVEPNYKIKLDSIIPNDPCFVKQWALDNTGQTCSGSTCSTPDADIDAPEAWDIIHDAHNIIVAVTDTGVDYRHPDLAPNMWSLPIDFYGQFRV